MAKFGWAYVDCESTGTGSGPINSIQYYIGSGSTKGSADLVFKDSNNRLLLTGSLRVSGAIHADNYYIKNRLELNVTGSTYFGRLFTSISLNTS